MYLGFIKGRFHLITINWISLNDINSRILIKIYNFNLFNKLNRDNIRFIIKNSIKE